MPRGRIASLPDAAANQGGFQFSIRHLLAIVAAISVALGIWVWLHRRPPFDFPEVAEIKRVTADYMDFPPFEVTRGSWEPLVAALSPSAYDPDPAKWIRLGNLKIQTRDGRRLVVGLFDLPYDRVGAFDAAWDREERRYFRGGNSAQLKQALAKAKAASKRQGTW